MAISYNEGRELGIATPVNEALTGLIKAITAKDTNDSDTLRIDGAVVQPLILNRTALAKLPVEHQITDVGSVQPGMKGQGIRVQGLLDVPALAIGADHVIFHSRDAQYAAGLTLAQAKQYGVLIYQREGQSIPEDQGGPYRLITPGLGDLCANVKGVCRIEIRCGPGKDTRTATCTPSS